jgi:hypothetical protein
LERITNKGSKNDDIKRKALEKRKEGRKSNVRNSME